MRSSLTSAETGGGALLGGVTVEELLGGGGRGRIATAGGEPRASLMRRVVFRSRLVASVSRLEGRLVAVGVHSQMRGLVQMVGVMRRIYVVLFLSRGEGWPSGECGIPFRLLGVH